MRRSAVYIFFFFSPLLFIAQSWKLPFSSKAEENGTGCNGAEITLYKNNSFVEKKITGMDGRFTFQLELNGDYRIEVTKPGYVRKIFTVTTRGVPAEESSHDFKGIELKAIVLFEPPKDCDVSALNKPLLRFGYDPNTKNFEYDQTEFDLSQEALANIAECEKLANANAKKFIKLMQEGRNAMAKKDCKTASVKFTQALEIKPKNEEAVSALTESDNLCAGHAKADLEYKEAMSLATAAVSSKQFEKAITEYQRALTLKPNEKEPSKKIEEVRGLIKIAENEKVFNELLKQGGDAVILKDYVKALELFNKAKAIDGNHPEPPRRIAEIKAITENATKYENAIKRGIEQQESKNWDEAINYYNEAISIKKDDPFAKQKIEECKFLKSKSGAENDEQNRFLAAMKTGKKSLSDRNWDDAIVSFKQALNIRKDDAEANSKLKEAEEGKKKATDNSRADELYLSAMKTGNDAMGFKNYETAIKSFTEALTYKKDDAPAKKKLDEAKDLLLKGNLARENEEKYSAAMQRGQSSLTSRKWVEAIGDFNEALSYKKDDAQAKAKIKEAEEGKRSEEKGKKSEELYASAMRNGNEALGLKKWTEAISDFTEALSIKKDDPAAQSKLSEANAGKAAEEQYVLSMKTGKKSLSDRNWDDAIVSFKQALSIRKDDAEANSKLKEAEEGKKLESDKNKIQELYSAAMKFGNESMTSLNFKDAISAYTSALNYKKDDNEAKKKLEEAKIAFKNQAENKEREMMFLDAIIKGENAMTEKKWELAIVSFKDALSIRKNDETAIKKLKDAEAGFDQMKKDQEQQKKFDNAMRNGKDAMAVSKWEEAILAFNAALEIKKDDPEALRSLNDAEEKLKQERNSKQELKNYEHSLSEGDVAVKEKNYALAMDRFTQAQKIKPESKVPADRIEALKKLIEEDKKIREIEEAYHKAMKEGEDAEAVSSWEKAISIYEGKALKIKPGDQEAIRRVAECQKALKDKSFADSVANREKMILEKYKQVLNEAKILFTQKEYKKSLEKYNEANLLRKDETEPVVRIAEINLLLKKLEEEEKQANELKKLEEDFNQTIQQAKNLVSEKKYEAAREKYRRAQLLKPSSSVPPVEIKKLDELIKNQQANNNTANEIKYKTAMANGDNNFSLKNYQDALANYQEALKVKPDDALARKKIADTESMIKNQNGLSVVTLEEKYAKLPQGVTNLERVVTKDFISTKSVVKRGSTIIIYEKKEFNWGVIFYKNNETISGNEYEIGIKN